MEEGRAKLFGSKVGTFVQSIAWRMSFGVAVRPPTQNHGQRREPEHRIVKVERAGGGDSTLTTGAQG